MPDPKYIVAVAAYGDRAIAGPVVAVALVHAVQDVEPTFRYDSEGEKRSVTIASFEELPSAYRPPALEHLRKNALSFAPQLRPPASLREVTDVPKDTLELMGLAGVRAVEWLFHHKPERMEAKREEWAWHVYGDALLPPKYVFGSQQLSSDWQARSAQLLAKDMRDGFMMRAAKMFPNYRFDKHMGFPTKTHKAEIKKHGACSEHWSSL